jgi:hypothetical protein
MPRHGAALGQELRGGQVGWTVLPIGTCSGGLSRDFGWVGVVMLRGR